MFTESMIRLFAVALDRDAEKITEALLGLGVMQFVSITSFDHPSSALFKSEGVEAGSLERLTEVRGRIETFLGSVGIVPRIPPSFDISGMEPSRISEENEKIDALASELQDIRDRQSGIQNEILKYKEIGRQLDLYGSGISPEMLRTGFSFVTVRLGSFPAERESLLHNSTIPLVAIPFGESNGRSQLVVISMKRDRERVDTLLTENGWTPLEISETMHTIKGDVSQTIRGKLDRLREEQGRLQEKARTVVTSRSGSLIDSWTRIRVDEMRSRIQSNFTRSTHVLLFSGWIPTDCRAAVTRKIEAASEGRCHIEWLSPDTVSDLNEEPVAPPVKLRNPKLLAPFQMLVENFGIPEYGTVDPTPFIVVTYLAMFGLMFADMGQGAVLVLSGICGLRWFNREKRGWRNISSLLVWCGASSMVSGALFGSFFGFSATRPLWFDFHGIVTGRANPSSTGVTSIFGILGITVKFGIAVISCGLFFNWLNLALKKRWLELVFDKGGILGGWIYFGGIYCALYMIGHDYRELPEPHVLLPLIAFPALLLFLKGPLHAGAHGNRISAASVLTFTMEWVVELLELFGGYLSNTLSFMRVAGLGIAHVSLMVAFFTMAEMARGENPGFGSTVLWIVLIVTGNIMVIVLEGLSAGIQALRLNYYEFFTKFFHGTGKLFKPVTLREP